MKAEKMTGLIQIPASCQYELPEEAHCEQNRWIAGVAFKEGANGLCYLLDCGQLRSCLASVAP